MKPAEPPYVADLQWKARTDIGMRRAMNQDNHVVILAEDERTWATRGHVLMVADGMGAHAAGELASRLAVESLPHLYLHDRDSGAAQTLEKAIVETNAEIHRRGIANLDFRAMGTTASVLVLLPQGALIGHVGDSRVYRLRAQRLEQLTFDHSLQWELRALKIASESSDFVRNVPKNVITRSLGPNAQVTPDLEGLFPLELGDTFLICSDGLTGQIKDHEIGSLLAHLPLDEAAAVLVDLANLRGGPDNITLVLAKVAGPGLVTAREGTSQRAAADRRVTSGAAITAWVVSGVCWLVAAVLGLAEQRVAGILLAVAGAATLAIGLGAVFRTRATADKAVLRSNSLGKAPYVVTDCRDEDEFVHSLAEVVDELREAALESKSHVHWDKFEDLRRRAEASRQQGDRPAAIRLYGQGISFMMSQLRSRQNRKTDESVIDFDA